jgi:hypothetical protein
LELLGCSELFLEGTGAYGFELSSVREFSTEARPQKDSEFLRPMNSGMLVTLVRLATREE